MLEVGLGDREGGGEGRKIEKGGEAGLAFWKAKRGGERGRKSF